MLIPNGIAAFAVGTTNTSPANQVLAANAALNRWIKGVYVTNTTGAAIGFNMGVGAAATLAAGNADIAFGVQIPANAASYPVAQFADKGRKALGAGSLNEIMAFASGAGLLMNVVYSDDSLA